MTIVIMSICPSNRPSKVLSSPNRNGTGVMTVKRKRHRKHGKRRHVPGMRAKRHGTGTQCQNTLGSDTAQAKPIVADGRKTCQGKPRDTRLSRPCPQSQDWECGGLRHDRIISVRRQRMNGKASLALPLVDAGNIVSLSEAAGKVGVLLLKYMYI